MNGARTPRGAQFPRAVMILLRGLFTTVAGNVSLALLALALALSLWLYVTDNENPTEEQLFNSAIDVQFVNVPNGLAISQTSSPTVRIQIEAPKNDIEDLSQEDFEATIDLGGLDRGANDMPVDVSSSNGDVNVVSISPARIEVTLEEERTKDVPVRVSLVGEPQQGFDAVGQNAQPDMVTVRGPLSLVEQVDSAVAEVNLAGFRVDLNDERVTLQPRDIRDGVISRVQTNPETAQVDVDLQQTEYSLEFRVSPTTSGVPASGYNVAAVTVDPRLVVVTGPLEALESIDAVRGIATDEISIADQRDDVIRTVQLVLPDNVRVEGGTSVRVTVNIDPAQGEFSFSVSPIVQNVGDGLVLIVPDPVVITLAGDVPILSGLTAQSIVITANAQGLGPGVYALPMDITQPPGTTVARVEPAQLGIALTPRQ